MLRNVHFRLAVGTFVGTFVDTFVGTFVADV